MGRDHAAGSPSGASLKAAQRSSSRSGAASGALSLNAQSLDSLRLLQMTIGNQALLNMASRAAANGNQPIQQIAKHLASSAKVQRMLGNSNARTGDPAAAQSTNATTAVPLASAPQTMAAPTTVAPTAIAPATASQSTSSTTAAAPSTPAPQTSAPAAVAPTPTAPGTGGPGASAIDPQWIGLSAMRLKVQKAQEDGTFGQADDHEAERTVFDNANDTSEISNSGVGGQSDHYQDISDGLKDRMEKAEEAGEDTSSLKADKAKVDRENQKLSVASGVLDIGSGFVGLINMRKAIKEADGKAETAGALYEGLESVQKAFAGAAKITDNAAKLEGSEEGVGSSEAVSGYGGSVGDALAAIKSAFFLVKDIYSLFKECFSEDGIAKEDAVKGGLSALQNGLESAQSAVKTVKSILEVMESGVGKLTETIPAIGIAISGIKVTIKVFNMMQWNASKQKMTEIKADFKQKYSQDKYKHLGIVKDNTYTLFGKTIHQSKGTDKTKIDDYRRELLDIVDDSNTSATEEAKKQARDELNDIEHYEIAKEMKSINQKRMTRAGIEAGLEMVSMAGDIATLSGAGAAVGISLKAAASGAKTGLSLFRRVKQYGRDKAAKSGPDSAWSSVFNAEKSSDKKHAKRANDADLILSMVAKLPESDDTIEAKGQFQRVMYFIEATGCDKKALFKANGEVGKQRELLMEAMKSRD
ncbi:hypothetical protein [Cohnella cellulosilytica]|uniref:Uncharacterized protein n=1 Tax=Cohnella cellulosilytica TaxID=986710 RepID=A0ABW2FBT5_9BACL